MKIQITYTHPELAQPLDLTLTRRQTVAVIGWYSAERRVTDPSAPVEPLPHGLEATLEPLASLMDEHGLVHLSGHIFIMRTIYHLLDDEADFTSVGWRHEAGTHRITFQTLPH